MEVGLSPGDCVRWRPRSPSPKKEAEPHQIFGPCLLWPNGWMDQDHTWHGGRPQPRRPCGVRWGPSPPPQKGVRALFQIFGPFLLWPNGWMHQDTTWYGARPQPRGLCVRWGHSPLPQKGRSPKFPAHVYCAQTAGCITVPLGMEVSLSPGDFVFDGDPAPLPNFRPMSIVTKRLDGSRWHLAWRWDLAQATLW